MRRVALLALVATVVAAGGACTSGGGASPSPTITATRDWDAAALKVADGLVAKLHAAKARCSNYIHWNYPLLSSDYASKGLPIPAAVTACTGAADEDLTIEVFVDEAAKDEFVAAKRRLLCNAAARKSLDFPGFPYVDGGTWIFEPDEPATASAAQKILGGVVKNASCDG